MQISSYHVCTSYRRSTVDFGLRRVVCRYRTLNVFWFPLLTGSTGSLLCFRFYRRNTRHLINRRNFNFIFTLNANLKIIRPLFIQNSLNDLRISYWDGVNFNFVQFENIYFYLFVDCISLRSTGNYLWWQTKDHEQNCLGIPLKGKTIWASILIYLMRINEWLFIQNTIILKLVCARL